MSDLPAHHLTNDDYQATKHALTQQLQALELRWKNTQATEAAAWHALDHAFKQALLTPNYPQYINTPWIELPFETRAHLRVFTPHLRTAMKNLPW